MRMYINRNWQFVPEFKEELLQSENWNDSEKVTLPHTVKETPFHYFDESEYQMISGYHYVLEVPDEWKQKIVLLTFEGAAHVAEVYLNGKLIGSHGCGYTAFTVKLDQLNYGQTNHLVVKLDSRESVNVPPFGHVIDYMTYGGLYRDVYLDIKESLYLEDVFVHSDIHRLVCDTTLNMEANCVVQISMSKHHTEEYTLLKVESCTKKMTSIEVEVNDIDLWDIDHPHLYDIKIQLLKNDAVLDEKVIVHGFRTAEFRKDGFYLNGNKVKIRGLNRHQSYAYVGYAMPSSMQRLDADILKHELGCNAVRTSHYPQSHEFIARCDEIGLLVFTEIPGWQHIGDEAWKNQACENVKDMVLQYRNHCSIVLWGVRINESSDDDAFYQRTNEIAHRYDPTRPTGGVRNFKKSHLFEDVYTYNDFVHEGNNIGVEAKNRVTADANKAYLVTEYNGHMFPTKSFDCEPHRTQHALRHAKVLNDVASYADICGSFGWCMADYNTHQDFGSTDRICYHGVLDMFRNPKMAAAVYASQSDDSIVLETSSSMEIGEYPGSALGTSYIFTNADSVRMYKNSKFIKEYTKLNSPYPSLKYGPIAVDDLIGDLLISEEGFTKDQSDRTKALLNAVATYGMAHVPLSIYLKVPKLLLKYKMTVQQVTSLYTKYIGNWGESAVEYRFDAIKKGQVVKSVVKAPMKQCVLHAEADHTNLKDGNSYDVALVRIRMASEHGQTLQFSHEPVFLKTEGPIEIIGPSCVVLQGGMAGTYVRSSGEGSSRLILRDQRNHEVVIEFENKGE